MNESLWIKGEGKRETTASRPTVYCDAPLFWREVRSFGGPTQIQDTPLTFPSRRELHECMWPSQKMMQSLMYVYACIKRARGAPDPVSPTKEKRTDSSAFLIFQNGRGASKQAPPF